jgi:hypothetical protein
MKLTFEPYWMAKERLDPDVLRLFEYHERMTIMQALALLGRITGAMEVVTPIIHKFGPKMIEVTDEEQREIDQEWLRRFIAEDPERYKKFCEDNKV